MDVKRICFVFQKCLQKIFTDSESRRKILEFYAMKKSEYPERIY